MMTNDYHRQYSREYREAGFGRLNDRRYNEKRAERKRVQERERMRIKRAKSKGLL